MDGPHVICEGPDGGFVVTQNGGIDFSIFEIFGTLRIVADDFWAPNGIVLEPDGETLLVVENGRHGEGHGFVRLHPDGLPLHAAPAAAPARQPGI